MNANLAVKSTRRPVDRCQIHRIKNLIARQTCLGATLKRMFGRFMPLSDGPIDRCGAIL